MGSRWWEAIGQQKDEIERGSEPNNTVRVRRRESRQLQNGRTTTVAFATTTPAIATTTER